MEKLIPTTPPGEYTVYAINMNWRHGALEISLSDDMGGDFTHFITGAAATTMMNDMNKDDHSVTSLHKTVLDKLVADGIIAGTISGTPD